MAFNSHWLFDLFPFFFKHSFSGRSEKASLWEFPAAEEELLELVGVAVVGLKLAEVERERFNKKSFQKSVLYKPGCCRERQQRTRTVVVQFYFLVVVQARPLEQMTQAGHSSLLDGAQGLPSVFVSSPASFVAPLLVCSFGSAHWVEWMGRGGRRDAGNTNSHLPPSLQNNLRCSLHSLHDLTLRTFTDCIWCCLWLQQEIPLWDIFSTGCASSFVFQEIMLTTA